MSRTGTDAATFAQDLCERAGDGSIEWVNQPIQAAALLDIADMLNENDRLVRVLHEVEREAVHAYKCLQKDCETITGSASHYFDKWWHAECQNDRLKAENAKQRKENAELRVDVDLMNYQLRARAEERNDLQAENAKLREELAKARDPQRIGGRADPSSFVYAIEQLREFRWQHATNDEDAIPYINNVAAAHERENDKLRVLVRDIWQFTRAACKKYPKLFDQPAQGGQMVQPNAIDFFEQRMRELGIEVPE